MNVAIVRGVVSRDPDIRTLADGTALASFDLVVEGDGNPRAAVPVVVALGPRNRRSPGAGDELVVVGPVRRRFFRTGGSTQSRTEVVARDVVSARDRRRVRRVLEGVSGRLAD
jgi:single-strand DNA-binding protein